MDMYLAADIKKLMKKEMVAYGTCVPNKNNPRCLNENIINYIDGWWKSFYDVRAGLMTERTANSVDTYLNKMKEKYL